MSNNKYKNQKSFGQGLIYDENFNEIDLDEIDPDDQREYIDVKKIIKDQEDQEDYIDTQEIIENEEIKSKPSFNVSENSKKLQDLFFEMQNEIKQIKDKLLKYEKKSREMIKNNRNIALFLDNIEENYYSEYEDKIKNIVNNKEDFFLNSSELKNFGSLILKNTKNEIEKIKEKVSEYRENSEEIQKIQENLSSLNEDFEIFQGILERAINFKKQEEKENELLETNQYDQSFQRNLSNESGYRSGDENDLSFTQKEELRRSESRDSGLKK